MQQNDQYQAFNYPAGAATQGVAAAQEPAKHSNVFVRGLPLQLSEEGLSSIFAQYGTVQTCRLVIDLKSGVSRGYGFVKLLTVEEAEAAIASLNGSVLQDRPLEVRLADAEPTNKFTGQQPSNNLYIRNLPLSTQDGDLGSMFAPYGSVLEKRILPLVDGAMGAGALVRMGSTEEATAAIGGLHNQTPMGATLPLLLRYADTPEEKARKAAKRDRSGAFVPQNQPAQGPFSPAARMQQPYQSTPGQMQQGYPSNPTGHQMQSPMGSYPSGGYPQAQQMQAPMDGYAAPGGYSSAQPGYQQQQQPQQQPQQMPQQQPMAGGQSQTAGYYPGPQQGGMQGYPNQPAAAPAFSGVADAGGIPGLGGPKQPQNDFSAYSAQGTPGPTGMNGQFSGHGAASATGTPGGPGGQPPYMPAANAAGPASTPGMNGNFMQMPGPAPGGGPFMQGGMQQGFGPQGGGLPPGGPPMMGGPSMGGPGFGPPGGMGVPMQPMGGPMGMPMQPQGYTPSSLYVKNLPPEADKLFLYEKFAPFGAIQGLKLLTHDTGKCKGVAFVNFSSNQAASEAIAALHQTKVGERVLHVSLQLFRGQRG